MSALGYKRFRFLQKNHYAKMNWFLRTFFHLLYHSFAWSYDLVASVVSDGRWKDWVRSVLPLIKGKDVLELGSGTGTLQVALIEAGYFTLGIDQSRQMMRIAKTNLGRMVAQPGILMRGRAQELPFADASMDTIVATFPSGYITRPSTLLSCRRVLRHGGRLVVLLGVNIADDSFKKRLLRGLYLITRQTLPPQSVLEKLRVKMRDFGFTADFVSVTCQQDVLTVMVATADWPYQPGFIM